MDKHAVKTIWTMFDAPMGLPQNIAPSKYQPTSGFLSRGSSTQPLSDGLVGHLTPDYATGSSSPGSNNYLAYLMSTLTGSESCCDTGPMSRQDPCSAPTTMEVMANLPSFSNNYRDTTWGVSPILATRPTACGGGRGCASLDSSPTAHKLIAFLSRQQAIQAQAHASRVAMVANVQVPAAVPMHHTAVRRHPPNPSQTACAVSAVGGTAAVMAGLHPRVEAVPGLGAHGTVCAPGAELPTASLYVKNLPTDADELMMYRIFSPCGPVLSCRVHTNPATGACRGVGFVNYADAASALKALAQLQGVYVAEGRMLSISLQAPRALRTAASAAHAAHHHASNAV